MSHIIASGARAGIVGSLLSVALVGAAIWPGAASAQGDFQSPASFTRTYHGADGSVLSMRQVGTQVVGFSQDPLSRRAWVFIGQRSGQTLSGSYVMLPRGGNTTQGNLTFGWSNAGTTLSLPAAGGVGTQSWVAKLPSSFVFPHGGEARFQSTSASDMDGAYRGSDGSRAWVRQTAGSQFFWYVERFDGPTATRPAFATVGTGTVGAQGQLVGQWWDLPSQTSEMRNGNIVGARISGSRDFAQSLVAATAGVSPRAATFQADYAIDLDRFALEIDQRLAPYAIGYGWAIAQNGKVVRTGANGQRRMPNFANGMAASLPYTVHTLNEAASTAKTITLMAVLRALRARGLSVDSPVSPHLPAHWVRGTGMTTVTFRQMLSHGMKPKPGAGLFKPADCSADPYDCLRNAVAVGMTEPPGYDNIHYTLMRFVLPMLRDPVGTTLLCANQADKLLSNQCFSAEFRRHIRNLLAETGVDADFAYDYKAGENGAYRYVWATRFDAEIVPSEAGSQAHYLEAGSGGLKIKPSEFARFLSRVELGGVLLPADLQLARRIGFGGQSGFVNGPDGVGPLWTKNGKAGGALSQLMVYPGTEVYVSQNTSDNPSQPSLSSMLSAAWSASLVGLPR